MNENDNLQEILLEADKHPQSRVSKLIRHVEAEPTQKNIVLLLIEIAEHAEYATNFGISLKYYLDFFERLGVGRDIMLNETSLLLINSAKIYSRRVDFVHELIEQRLLSLSNANKEMAVAKNDEVPKDVSGKPKRGRKRLLEIPKDPYEVELVPKKIRKISKEKRFANNNNNSSMNNASSMNYAKLKALRTRQAETEQYLHPAGWMHASIVDFENDDEIDTKRNYKLFTYHIEHRYNTLVPDINFRLHFMVKDFIEEQEEHMEEENTTWPPLSEAYVDQYLNLENRIFNNVGRNTTRKRNPHSNMKSPKSINIGHNVERDLNIESSASENNNLDTTSIQKSKDKENNPTINDAEIDRKETEEHRNLTKTESTNDMYDKNITSNNNSRNTHNDSGITNLTVSTINTSDASTTLNLSTNTENLSTSSATLNTSVIPNESQKFDSGLGNSIFDSNNSNINDNLELSTNAVDTTSAAADDTTETSPVKSIQSLQYDSTSGVLETNAVVADNDGMNRTEDCGIDQIDDGENGAQNSTQISDVLGDDTQINLNDIRVYLPHLDDEGVFFADLDKQDQLMLSPTVLALDIFPNLPIKKNLTIVVDDEMRAMLNLPDEERETYTAPTGPQPITLNIMKIPERNLRHKVLFKLGEDFKLFLQTRSLKRPRNTTDESSSPRQHCVSKLMSRHHLNDTDMSGVHISPINSPGNKSNDFYGFSGDDDDDTDMSEFMGFSDDSDSQMSNRLSRDSGVDSVDDPLMSRKDKQLQNSSEVNNKDEIPAQENADTRAGEKPSENDEKLTTGDIRTEDSQLSNMECHAHVEANVESSNHNNNNSETLSDATTTNLNLEAGVISENSCNESERSRKETKPISQINDVEIYLNKSQSKVQQWHQDLQPILAKSRERHHFDVFAIGTEIMDELVQDKEKRIQDASLTSRRPCISFQEVMENKDNSYVSRYFLSSLLLINQGNISIIVDNKHSEKPSEWNDIKLELLSTKRYTVSIEDNIGMLKRPLPLEVPTSSSNKIRKKTKLSTKSRNFVEQKVERVCEIIHVDLSAIKALKQIDKLPSSGDDIDSGIFSSEEVT